jgi:acyl-CoA synthetase (AMP-forming)/AMP-acid ligase II
MSLNIADGVRTFAVATPSAHAVLDGDRTVTFAELDDRSSRLASHLLDRGLRPGSRVGVATGNRFEFLEMVTAAGKAGMVLVPLSPWLTTTEAMEIAVRSRVSAVIAEVGLGHLIEDSFRRTLSLYLELDSLPQSRRSYESALVSARPTDPRVKVNEESPFVISFTGGTTGRPKGVLISHRSRCITFLCEAVSFGFGPGRVMLAVTPMCHGAGLTHSYAAIYTGTCVSIMNGWDPETFLHQIVSSRSNSVFLVPSHLQTLRSSGLSISAALADSRLGTVFINAAPTPHELKEWLLDELSDIDLHELYGSTEGGNVTCLPPADQLRKPHSVGPPWFMTQVKLLRPDRSETEIGEPGELFSKSPFLFSGYLDDPETTAASMTADGFFSAGDIAVRDRDGYLSIVDRLKDMIISGGMNVYSREVEEILVSHEAVSQAAIVGVPDDRWGERVVAFVVPQNVPSPRPGLPDELIAYCRARLARYKCPKDIAIVEALPRTKLGKVQKNVLRDLFPHHRSQGLESAGDAS